MKKKGIVIMLLSLSLAMVGCGKNDISDIIDTTTSASANVDEISESSESDIEDVIEEDDNFSYMPKLQGIKVKGNTPADFEGSWVDKNLYSSDVVDEEIMVEKSYFATIIDGKIAIETWVKDDYCLAWSGSFDDIKDNGNDITIISKRGSAPIENKEAELEGDTLELTYSDGVLSFNDGKDTFELMLLTIKANSDDKDNSENDNVFFNAFDEKILELYNDLDVKCKYSDEYAYVFFTNNRDSNLSFVNFNIEHYDEFGVTTEDTEYAFFESIKPNQTVVAKLKISDKYKTFSIACSVYNDIEGMENLYDLYMPLDSVDVNANVIGDQLNVTFENTTSQNIRNISYMVVFYKDGKVVDIEEQPGEESHRVLGYEGENEGDDEEEHIYEISEVSEYKCENVSANSKKDAIITIGDVQFDDYEIYISKIERE